MSPTSAGRLNLTLSSRWGFQFTTNIISSSSYTQEHFAQSDKFPGKVNFSSSLAGEAFSPSARNCSGCHCSAKRERIQHMFGTDPC